CVRLTACVRELARRTRRLLGRGSYVRAKMPTIGGCDVVRADELIRLPSKIQQPVGQGEFVRGDVTSKDDYRPPVSLGRGLDVNETHACYTRVRQPEPHHACFKRWGLA